MKPLWKLRLPHAPPQRTLCQPPSRELCPLSTEEQAAPHSERPGGAPALPPASESSPARLGSWGDTGLLGHSGLISPSVLPTERSGSLETVGAGAQAEKGGAEPAFSRSDSRWPDTHGQGPLPLLQPRRSVWVQGKSAPPGEGLKPSRAKPCPGRPRGFYGEGAR